MIFSAYFVLSTFYIFSTSTFLSIVWSRSFFPASFLLIIKNQNKTWKTYRYRLDIVKITDFWFYNTGFWNNLLGDFLILFIIIYPIILLLYYYYCPITSLLATRFSFAVSDFYSAMPFCHTNFRRSSSKIQESLSVISSLFHPPKFLVERGYFRFDFLSPSPTLDQISAISIPPKFKNRRIKLEKNESHSPSLRMIRNKIGRHKLLLFLDKKFTQIWVKKIL